MLQRSASLEQRSASFGAKKWVFGAKKWFFGVKKRFFGVKKRFLGVKKCFFGVKKCFFRRKEALLWRKEALLWSIPGLLSGSGRGDRAFPLRNQMSHPWADASEMRLPVAPLFFYCKSVENNFLVFIFFIFVKIIIITQ
jgi:hypothetical protein